MAYTALYRKFRPAVFEDVKGQDAIVTTLKNQIRTGRIGHAYLFCGTRGTGKTTVAKIFARAVNCESPENGNPCGRCEICRAIAQASSMNVIEMDAASNNGVDDVRQIREEVTYSPAKGKYKVYIIDEVHMLSTAAFNALLKTLEEPPSYVIFILATTDPQKLPLTILSRCQRYNFRRITQDTIMARLRELTERENVTAQDAALRYIARKGDGSMRDAISLLDQCIAFYIGEELTYDRALEVLGAVDTDVYSRLLRTVLEQDAGNAVKTLEELVQKGADLMQFVSDFTWYMRNLMLLKASDDMEDVLDVSSENLAQLTQEAAMIRQDTLMRFIRIFSKLSADIRYASNRRVLIEMALIRLCHPETGTDISSVMDRLRRLERMAEQGMLSAGNKAAGTFYAGAAGGAVPAADGRAAGYGYSQDAAGAEAGNGNPQAAGYAPGPEAASGNGYPQATGVAAGAPGDPAFGSVMYGNNYAPAYQRPVPEDLAAVRGQWSAICSGTSGMFREVLRGAHPRFNAQNPEDQALYVVFPDFLGERYIDNPARKAELEELIQSQTGKRIEVRFALAADDAVRTEHLQDIDIESKVKSVIHGIEVDFE